MKQLEVEISLSEYNEKHVVYLGNMEFLKHKSKTFLKLYLRTYKKVLIDSLRVLNTYNAQIYTTFRHFYFDFDERTIQHLTDAFEQFNKQFNFVFDSTRVKENAIVFRKIDHAIGQCLDAVQLMKDHANLHKNYSLKNQANAYLKMLEDFREKLESDKRDLGLDRKYVNSSLQLIKNEISKVS